MNDNAAVRQEASFEPQSDRRRQHDRVRVELDVTLGSEHNFYAGFVENMSQGGIFIATHKVKAVGVRLDVSVNVPGFDQRVEGVGEVRWIRVYSEASNASPGLGLRFVELTPGSLEIINEFLKQREPLFFDE